MKISLALVLFFLCLPLPGASVDYTIVYTGRSLGYYRIPDLQPVSPSVACPGGNEEPPQVAAFRSQIASVAGPKILLATGDNFAPDLGARSLCNARGELVPKERSAWTGSDNVATFFRTLGFQAIAPGKLDFRYGPERFHQIARYLAGKEGPGTPVQMLAANLTIQTEVANPPAETAPPLPPQNYSLNTVQGAKFHLPRTLLPFIRQFDIEEGAALSTSVVALNGSVQTQALHSQDLATPGERNLPQPRYQHAWICSGELAARLSLPAASCRPLNIQAPADTTLTVSMPSDWPVFPSADSLLQGGSAFYLCASTVSSEPEMNKNNTLCSGTLRPQLPFLQSGGNPESNPLPYAIAPDSNTVIFGVVDSLLLTEIGELNYTWRNSNPAYRTQLQISDPLEALGQLLQTCNADANCKGRRKILLAQMPQSKAQRIALQLRGMFDAVVTQADADAATTDSTIVKRSPQQSRVPNVLVPAPNYSASHQGRLDVTSQRADIRIDPASMTVQNEVAQQSVSLRKHAFNGVTPLWQLMVTAGLSPAPVRTPAGTLDYKGVVLNSVLSVMRAYCKADAAFLQHRDLFIPIAYAFQQPAPGQLQELFDELLWKGDLVICRSASGKMLSAMKRESDQYDSSDQDRLAEPVEVGRGLDYLGMFSGKTGLVVGGFPITSGSLYSIATTDYLGVGDTGYPALHDPAVPAPAPMSDMSRLDEVSALVCNAIADALPVEQQDAARCRKPADPATYFDQITMDPFSQPAAVTAREKLDAWTNRNWATHDTLAPIRNNPAEVEAQNGRVLSLRLDRADIGFQQNLHSLSEKQLQNRFGGVQAPEPTAPEKLDAALDWLLRLTSSGKNVDRFVQTDAAYEASAIRQVFTSTVNGVTVNATNEPYQLSQPKNSVGVEAGFTTHLAPAHQKNETGLKLLTSARFETELGPPFLQFQASDGYLKENLPRKNALLGKVGIRYDGASSWLETGLQSGPFTQVTGLKLGPLSCDPSSVVNCVSPNGGSTILSLSDLAGRPFSVQSGQRNQSGIFLNARIHLPLLYKRLDYVIENSGSLYFNRAGDSSADTRYLEVMTHSLVVPVVGNLSMVPKVEFFLFQNKVAGWHIHGYQTSISAQYRFDWHTGIRWGQALRYPSPPQSNSR